jgi:large subunit ribosomal protein L4
MKQKVSDKAKKDIVKKEKLILPVYSAKAEEISKIFLPKEIFSLKPNNNLMQLAIRVYLFNQRKGLASTKTRSEVAGGGAKPWRQKGTGRARAGTIRAPHWRGGGAVFGPKQRDWTLKITKKMKKVALFSALSQRFKEGNLTIIEGINTKEPNTKKALGLLTKLRISSKILLVLPIQSQIIDKSFRNIRDISVKSVANLNIYDVLSNNKIIFTENAIEGLTKHFLLKGEDK